MNKRHYGCVVLAGWCLFAFTFSASVRAQPAPAAPPKADAVGAQGTSADPLTDTQIVERVTLSVDKALDYLRGQQQADGSWHRNQAVNALAMLAFLGRGHTPGRGPYRELLEKGKTFLVTNQRDDGYLSFSSMYEHGLATLALSELYGMDNDPRVERCLKKAVELITRCQNKDGGWRYNPNPQDADLSVTVMQIVALRAANNAGIPVPESTITRAAEYVRRCAHKDGGFAYQIGGQPEPPVNAAGILSLQLLGRFDDPALKPALARLAKAPVEWKSGEIKYFYYFHYYAIQANYQAGGNAWNQWHPRVREMLLSHQQPNGSWDVPPGTGENQGTVGPNRVYWTAMACLILEVYMHFLPAYQR